MDGITEPVVLILGHPIAGNPAQFALERAFDALDLQWRVLSCDVPPDRVEEAISGAEVLGFRGLLLDQNLVSIDDGRESGGEDWRRPDLYWRRDKTESGWNTENVLATLLEAEVRKHAEASGGQIGPLLWIGSADPSFPSQMAGEQTQSPIAWASNEAIEHANLIAISQTVDFSTWPACQGDKLVVDFANPPNEVDQVRALGYTVLGREQTRIGILLECIARWTGKKGSEEILTEAVEEYLAV